MKAPTTDKSFKTVVPPTFKLLVTVTLSKVGLPPPPPPPPEVGTELSIDFSAQQLGSIGFIINLILFGS